MHEINARGSDGGVNFGRGGFSHDQLVDFGHTLICLETFAVCGGSVWFGITEGQYIKPEPMGEPEQGERRGCWSSATNSDNEREKLINVNTGVRIVHIELPQQV